MHLTKHHGLGNDFLVLLPDDVVPMPDDVAAALARRLCHRTRGIGADGLIIGGALCASRATLGACCPRWHVSSRSWLTCRLSRPAQDGGLS